jgi:hypothetical protein
VQGDWDETDPDNVGHAIASDERVRIVLGSRAPISKDAQTEVQIVDDERERFFEQALLPAVFLPRIALDRSARASHCALGVSGVPNVLEKVYPPLRRSDGCTNDAYWKELDALRSLMQGAAVMRFTRNSFEETVRVLQKHFLYAEKAVASTSAKENSALNLAYTAREFLRGLNYNAALSNNCAGTLIGANDAACPKSMCRDITAHVQDAVACTFSANIAAECAANSTLACMNTASERRAALMERIGARARVLSETAMQAAIAVVDILNNTRSDTALFALPSNVVTDFATFSLCYVHFVRSRISSTFGSLHEWSRARSVVEAEIKTRFVLPVYVRLRDANLVPVLEDPYDSILVPLHSFEQRIKRDKNEAITYCSAINA